MCYNFNYYVIICLLRKKYIDMLSARIRCRLKLIVYFYTIFVFYILHKALIFNENR